MNSNAWRQFCTVRERFRELTESLDKELPYLKTMQQEMVNLRSGPEYNVETSVVYNFALDEIRQDDDLKLILVADNPGRREQEKRYYLVGPSGKIAEKFFRDNPSLGIDFRKNVIILNKTPIHTPRTAELRTLGKGGNESTESRAHIKAFEGAFLQSQKIMAALLQQLHTALSDSNKPVPVWIIGYSEMKNGGVFETYTKTLQALYQNEQERKDEIFLFRHFSMNQFKIDFNRQALSLEAPRETLDRIGRAYRKRILGW
ncbi:MAG: uracil-DNA glycosylase family protein [Treponema sp.]|jgi:hypothetical protein|nr:uracil-DNA glycosylase family protein [Treponema sp.]